MNIIFLDIDGVLNCITTKDRIPNSNRFGIESKKVKLLKRIIDVTNSKIVLTSTWKLFWDKNKNKEIQDKTGDYLDLKLKEFDIKIYDKTFDCGFNRGYGIYEYLNNNNIQNYIILDDSIFDDYDENLLKHLIKTEINIGLTEEHVEKAIKILKGEIIL